LSEIDVDEGEEQKAAPEAPAKRRYRRRHDVEAAGPAKKRGRKPAARFDSDVTSAAIDGYGDPLQVSMAKGWLHLWVTPRDANKYQARRWSPARWGDAEVLGFPASMAGKAGEAIKSPQGQLTLMKMRESDFQEMHRNDPNRRLHAQAAIRVREQRQLAASLSLGKD
jgi:hypothetical protein